MAIIVEGFDNSGKSTLANSLGLPVIHPGPRPQSLLEEYECFGRQYDLAGTPVVLDRVTCISSPCYTGKDWQKYAGWVRRMVDKPSCVVIYCRPPIEAIQDFSKHVYKSYDEVQQVQWLHQNASRIVDNYDLYMSQIPHMRYDYTNPDPEVIKLASLAQFSMKEWEKWQQKTLA